MSQYKNGGSRRGGQSADKPAEWSERIKWPENSAVKVSDGVCDCIVPGGRSWAGRSPHACCGLSPVRTNTEARLCLDHRLSGMYGPPLRRKRNVRMSQVGLRKCIRPLLEWITPGQDGMRCALLPISYSVFRDFFRLRV